jgi:hypothetical protein
MLAMGRKKIVGIAYAYDATEDEYELVKDAGIEWVRMEIVFPWENKMFGTLSERYKQYRHDHETAKKHGIKVMSNTPGMGGYFYDPLLKKTYFHESFPGFAGRKGTHEYYDNVRAAMQFVAEDLGDLASDYWQCMNEIDIPTFSKEMEEAAEIDGCGKFKTFFSVIFSLSKAGLATLAIYNGVVIWNEFVFAMVLTQTARARTLPLAIWDYQGQYTMNISLIMALLVLPALLVILLYVFGQDKLVKGMMAGAVKG